MFALWILLIVVLLLLIVLGTWLWGTIFGRGEVTEPLEAPEKVREQNAQAVADGRVDDLRFAVVVRGYRQDQVDPVIAQLAERIAVLESRLKGND